MVVMKSSTEYGVETRRDMVQRHMHCKNMERLKSGEFNQDKESERRYGKLEWTEAQEEILMQRASRSQADQVSVWGVFRSQKRS